MAHDTAIDLGIGCAFRAEDEHDALGAQTENVTRACVRRGQKETGEPRDARFAGDDGSASCPARAKKPHRLGRGIIVDRHKILGPCLENFPGKQRDLATGEPRHDRVEWPLGCGGTAGDSTAIKAVGLFGLDNDKARRKAPNRSLTYEDTLAAKAPTPP